MIHTERKTTHTYTLCRKIVLDFHDMAGIEGFSASLRLLIVYVESYKVKPYIIRKPKCDCHASFFSHFCMFYKYHREIIIFLVALCQLLFETLLPAYLLSNFMVFELLMSTEIMSCTHHQKFISYPSTVPAEKKMCAKWIARHHPNQKQKLFLSLQYLD